jgi:hypothetical protein
MQAEKKQKLDNGLTKDVLRKFEKGSEVARLRWLFLAPLAAAMLTSMLALMLALYWHEQRILHKGTLRIRTSAQDFFEDSIRYDSRLLQAIMNNLQRDPTLQAALASRDRQRLLANTGKLFDNLRNDVDITHFYFSNPDRINLLRVHAPDRYGDRIDRITALAAEKTAAPSVGVELGPLGTLTLRLVAPWHQETTRQLLGYVELGMEIDHVLQKLRHFFGVEVFVLIDKRYLDRRQWEEGMRILGHKPDWDRFSTVVLGGHATQAMPPFLAERISRGEQEDSSSIPAFFYEGSTYAVSKPMSRHSYNLPRMTA